jgi:glycosyltransferase involved in cell wall biosynthesis
VGLVRVWALEPYYGGSHRQFLEGLCRHSTHAFTLFTLPGRHWKWRMHGGALTLAAQVADHIAGGEARPDVFVASDMLDLPVFLASLQAGTGTVPLGRHVPSVVYFHENQLTYPLPPGVDRDLGYGFKNLTTALAAETVLFNSEYHRGEFVSAARALLAGMPDALPGWAADEVAAKAKVLPLGCDLRSLDRHRARAMAEAAAGRWGDPAAGPLVVWNQRWEYDKAPETLFLGLAALKDNGVAFRVALAGSGAAALPEEFSRARAVLGDRVVHLGRLESRSDYAALLWAADVVASTAIHEFFGVSVLEAVYCGCRPVLPRRLSYPELIPRELHADVLYEEAGFVEALARALARPREWSEDWQRTWAARFDWGSLKTRYDETIWECATGTARRGRP